MTLNPLAFIAALATLAAPPQEAAPKERQAAFLKSVKEGKLKEAYAELLRGSPVMQNTAEVANLVTQTEKGLQVYGGLAGVENQGLARETGLIALGTAVVACEKGPLFFYFVWFRPREDAPWRIQTSWFDDNAKAFFGK